jgi:hypothetical protein
MSRYTPKLRDSYYYINHNGATVRTQWVNNICDYYNYNHNNCFKTVDEITDDQREAIKVDMKALYNEHLIEVLQEEITQLQKEA